MTHSDAAGAPVLLGDWEEPGETRGYQRMDVTAGQLAAFWRRCSLSANFWARYTALLVPTPAPPGWLSRSNLEHVLAHMLNELFENCAKFSGGPQDAVVYECFVREEDLVFRLTNHIAAERRESFARFVEWLFSDDLTLDDKYFQRIEESAETGDRGSGLGYLMMMKDYGIRFGFRFTPLADAAVAVTVQAHVNFEER